MRAAYGENTAAYLKLSLCNSYSITNLSTAKLPVHILVCQLCILQHDCTNKEAIHLVLYILEELASLLFLLLC